MRPVLSSVSLFRLWTAFIGRAIDAEPLVANSAAASTYWRKGSTGVAAEAGLVNCDITQWL